MENKLTIDQLKNYLGTGLKFGSPLNKNGSRVEVEISGRHLTERGMCQDLALFKPICYRLSDLDNFIPELGFVPIDELKRLGLGSLPRSLDFKWLYFHQIQKLFQWHFWVFGDEYFDQGLVIDKLKHGE